MKGITKSFYFADFGWFVALRFRGLLHMVSERGYNSGAVGLSTDL